MSRNHEIDSHLLTPARDHLIFPDISGSRRTQSHGFVPVKEDVPSRETDSEHYEGLFDRLGINGSRKPNMTFSVNEYLMKRKMNHKLSEEECLPASAKPNRADKDNEQR